MVAAMQAIHTALRLLTQAMLAVPMASELHTDILATLKKLGSHMAQAGQPQQQGLDTNAMLQTIRRNQAQAPQMQALDAMFAQQQQQPQPPTMPQGAP